MKILCILLLIQSLCLRSLAQGENEEMGGFNQIIDISSFVGTQFKLSVYAKTENENVNISFARIFVSVSTPEGTPFNKYELVTSSQWREYSIEGQIDVNSKKLVLGGYYYGIGKYYFDKFRLEIKQLNGEWEMVDIANSGFENESLSSTGSKDQIFNKWIFGKKNGFERCLTTDNSLEGKQALLIDGSSKTKNGNFSYANGIKIYYEFHGHGNDTILFLHGNGQSIKSFSKQIPDFSNLFTVLAMDSRAHGYTSDDGKEVTYELMANDVTSLLNNLRIKSINVLGWSDGGNTGLILAMNQPNKVKQLAAMGANLFCDNTSVDERVTDQLRKEQNRLETENTPKTNFQLRMIHLLLNEPNIRPDDLKNITCKTLIMAGSKDLIKEKHTRIIAKNIKNSELVIFKDGTHFEPQENPERFNKTVIEFFKAGNRQIPPK